MDDPVLLQLPQLLGQHFGGSPGNQPLELTEPLGPPRQVPQNEGLILTADQIQGRFHRTVVAFPLLHPLASLSFWVLPHLKVRSLQKENFCYYGTMPQGKSQTLLEF